MIIPSIDLQQGKAVQLKQGRERMLERDNPLELAAYFDRFGEIAVIDLDASMNKGNNQELIKGICRFADCRVGGGIRTVEKAKELISHGAVKVIIGSRAFENNAVNHRFLKMLKSAIGKEHMMIAIDAYEGEIVTRAWKHRTGLKLFDVVRELEPYASEFLFTCVEKEGLLRGTDMDTVRRLRTATETKLTVAGGVTTMEEIKQVASLDAHVQLGMALYTEKIKLEEAFIEMLNWKADLMPTVTCDTANQVLMVAYSNKESLRRTFASGTMWYYSRSRDTLWMKGETSGNLQHLCRFRRDCDGDALLATVRQQGVACHRGTYSCFGDKRFSLNELYEVIRDRFNNPVSGSYTATLTDEKVKEKLLEEMQELIEAREKEDVIWETADVLYFVTALLAKRGIDFGDVLNELRRRRGK